MWCGSKELCNQAECYQCDMCKSGCECAGWCNDSTTFSSFCSGCGTEACDRRMSTEQEPDQKISEESIQDIFFDRRMSAEDYEEAVKALVLTAQTEDLLNPAFRRMSDCPMWCGAKELCNMSECAQCDMCQSGCECAGWCNNWTTGSSQCSGCGTEACDRRMSTEQEPDQKISEESIQLINNELVQQATNSGNRSLASDTPDSAINQCSSWAPRGFIQGRPSIASGVWCQVGISSAEGNDWKECVDGVTKPAEPALIYTGLCPSSEKESGDIHV